MSSLITHFMTTGGTIAATLQQGTYGTAALTGEELLAGIATSWQDQLHIAESCWL